MCVGRAEDSVWGIRWPGRVGAGAERGMNLGHFGFRAVFMADDGAQDPLEKKPPVFSGDSCFGAEERTLRVLGTSWESFSVAMASRRSCELTRAFILTVVGY